MLSGFNTNVRHKGVVFHVQTEDSGRAHPHVITHLFHGGNILASEKASYEHLLQEAGELEGKVKRLMEEQHSTMVEKLKSGTLNAVIRERLGSGAAAAEGDAAQPIRKVEVPSPPPPAPSGRAAAEPPAPPPPAPKAPAAEVPAADAGQRPLDEVVLEYLLESARARGKR